MKYKIYMDDGSEHIAEIRNMIDPGVEGCGQIMTITDERLVFRHIVRMKPISEKDIPKEDRDPNLCPKCEKELTVRKQETQRGDAFYPFCEGCGYRGVRIKKDDVADPDSVPLIEE